MTEEERAEARSRIAEGKGLRSSREVQQLIVRHYSEAQQAHSNGKLVAWLTALSPVELLYAMEVVPVFPENYSAVCASTGVAPEYMEAAESKGYSRDLCSYFRCNFGHVIQGGGPMDGLPKPDFLLATGNVCYTRVKWWETLSHTLKAPLFFIDVPTAGEYSDYAINYFMSQLQDFTTFLEKQTGHKLDDAKLKEAIQLSDRTGALWTELMELRRKIPCPMGVLDALSDMFVLVTYVGTKAPVELLEKVRDEVRDVVKHSIGVVPNEKYRLLFDNIPPWFDLRLIKYFQSYGGSFVVEPYTQFVWSSRMDPSKPLRSLAVKYVTLGLEDLDRKYPNLGLKEPDKSGFDIRILLNIQFAKEYSVDAVVIHWNRSCKQMSIGEMEVKNSLQELGLPVLVFEGDMVDQRYYQEDQVKAKIDAFFEMLGQQT
nr:2-hydroxyacyl-CoA dehydratase family protein [Candidatus Njordarchaeota archaeon]